MSKDGGDKETGDLGEVATKAQARNLVLKCHSQVHKSGVAHVDFEFLARWLDESTCEAVWGALTDRSKRVRGSQWAYATRRVLVEMIDYGFQLGWKPRLNPSPGEVKFHLGRFRAFYFRMATSLQFSYLNHTWTTFLRLLPLFQVRGLFVGLNAKDDEICRLPSGRDSHGRRDATNIYEDVAAPSGKHPPQSRSSDLLEPIPIVNSNVNFLEDYAEKLGTAVDTIRNCAMDDLKQALHKRDEGRRLLATVNYAAIHSTRSEAPRFAFIDPTNGFHYFKHDGNHPNLLANLIALCRYEMGQFTRPITDYPPLGTGSVRNGPWRYVFAYGREKLLPYLGLPTIYEAIACIIVVLLEHPKFTIQSLMMGEFQGGTGDTALVSDGGLQTETSASTRMTVDKWRALSQKTSILTPKAADAVQIYLELTESLRKYLRAQGKEELANQMWIGVGIVKHAATTFDIHQLSRAYGTLERRTNPRRDTSSKQRVKSKGCPMLNFYERHPILMRWSATTLKGLRVSSGILKFIRSGGDLSVAIEAFGHSGPMTTIRNYLPPALLEQIYERQHRRHQNSLITWATDDQDILLQSTDFPTLDELNQFLSSGIRLPTFSSNVPVSQTIWQLDRRLAEERSMQSELVLIEDAQAIAVLLLYREHLIKAPKEFLEKSDPVTGLTPRFWSEFSEAIQGELPPSLSQIREVVALAKLLYPTLSETTSFGAYWR